MDDDESEPQIEFTDEEWAFLRYVRFGELPRRVTPEERVESQETEPDRGWPDPMLGQWRDLASGGA